MGLPADARRCTLQRSLQYLVMETLGPGDPRLTPWVGQEWNGLATMPADAGIRDRDSDSSLPLRGVGTPWSGVAGAVGPQERSVCQGLH